MIPHRVYEKKWRVPEIGYFQMSNIGCFSFFIFEHVRTGTSLGGAGSKPGSSARCLLNGIA